MRAVELCLKAICPTNGELTIGLMVRRGWLFGTARSVEKIDRNSG